MYCEHRTCRACGYAATGAQGTKVVPTEKLIEVLNLGIQPLANDFQNEFGNHAGYAPLKVLYCPRCSLAQLSVVVRPDILYSHYSYVTGTSDTVKAHFAALWAYIQAHRPVKRLVEIGSNTGDFLAFCREHGAVGVIGIDPAENLAQFAIAKKVTTIVRGFDCESAGEAHRRMGWGRYGGVVDAVVARHVFCHIDDWREFLNNLKEIGDEETIYCIEVPYAPDMISVNSFDQIYHEHLSYFTLKAMDALLKESGLHIHSFKKYPIHGGAIVVTLRRDESKVPPDSRCADEIAQENVTATNWYQFSERAERLQRDLKIRLDILQISGARIASLGASAKSTVWINACGLTRKNIAFIADNTPQKQFTFSPGSDIPIVDEGALLREMPDFTVVWAWNFLPEILKKHGLYRERGGKFIVPIPELKII